jgi:hypothetical protein
VVIKIGLKYYGGCNPKYDSVELVRAHDIDLMVL